MSQVHNSEASLQSAHKEAVIARARAHTARAASIPKVPRRGPLIGWHRRVLYAVHARVVASRVLTYYKRCLSKLRELRLLQVSLESRELLYVRDLIRPPHQFFKRLNPHAIPRSRWYQETVKVRRLDRPAGGGESHAPLMNLA